MFAKLLLRKALGRFLRGDGIEIGGLHQPLPLDGLKIDKIRYVDRLQLEQLRKHYPELSDQKFVKVDVVDDGETLSAFSAESLDFIIANHFIEHTHNPVGTIRSWLKKLRRQGVIYMAVPDKRMIFDHKRPITTLEHLIEDDQLSTSARSLRDRAHYFEYAELVDDKQGDEITRHAENLIANDQSIHFHTFVSDTFLNWLRYLQKNLGLSFDIIAFVDTLPDSDEFIAVLRKA